MADRGLPEADLGTEGATESSGDGLLRVLAYATAPNADLYVAVMDAAIAARERFRLQLRPADLVDAARVTRDEAVAALEFLADHGALHKTYDPSEAETVAEYYRGAFLYQVTPAGIAAHEGVQAVLATRMAQAGRLSASLLPGIHDALGALGADTADEDDSRLKADLSTLFALVDELADSAATYLRELDAEVAELAADTERLGAYKRAVLAYLERFNRELGVWTPRITERIDALASVAGDLITRAASLDAAPRPDGSLDDGPVEQLTGQWEGTVAWFCDRPAQRPVVAFVNDAMIAAINRVLSAISRLHDRRLRRVSREADFMQLAEWFAGTDPQDTHALWDATTGLWRARHFSDLAGDEAVDRRRSFWEAGTAELPPRVRTSTRRGSTGRPGKRADYSAAKAHALDRVLAAETQATAAWARLAARTPTRLSDLGTLDVAEFDALLDVISAALAEHPVDGVRTAVLAGATVRLMDADDDRTAAIVTSQGTLRGPDLLLEIEIASSRRRSTVAS